jgi:hypothetical protein
VKVDRTVDAGRALLPGRAAIAGDDEAEIAALGWMAAAIEYRDRPDAA